MRAIYRGVLATVTECQGNPGGPTDPADLPDGFAAARGALSAHGQAIVARMWDSDGVVLDHELWVSLLDPDLVEDPTDAQVAAVEMGTWPRLPAERQVRRHFGAPA